MDSPPAPTSLNRPAPVNLTGTILTIALFVVVLVFLSELSVVGVLYIVLSSALTLGVLALGAWGLGQATTRHLAPGDGGLIHTVAGLGLLWLIFEILGTLGLANVPMAWGLCAAGAMAGFLVHRQVIFAQLSHAQGREIHLAPWLQWHGGWLWVAAPLAVIIVAACCPPGTLWAVEAWGYDVLSYHLQIPREWLDAGRIHGLTHNVYSYFPSLVEAGFLQLGLMRGDVFQAVYTCQLLNVALALVTAAILAQLVRKLAPPACGKTASIFALALYLATPWVLITASMAYDESMVLALTAAALSLSLTTNATNATDTATPHRPLWKAAVLVGLLLGLATLAKLTSGLMLALPIGLIWLVRLAPITGQLAWKKALGLTAVLTLAGAITLLPYLVRNAVWTGNPVFPFAAQTLGKGHWNDALAQRFKRGHHVNESLQERLTALGQQWVFNTGYGAIAGRPRSHDPGTIEARNVAYFPRQWGVPTLLLAALAGGVLMMMDPRRRRLAIALGVVIFVQIICWLFLTHLQSRFMIYSLPMVVVLAAAGLALPASRWWATRPIIPIALATLLVGCLTFTGIGLARQQVIGHLSLSWVIDGLPTEAQLLDPTRPMESLAGESPINKLPAWSKTLLIADNSRLFYIRRPMVYHSAFDASPLGELIRAKHHNPQAITDALVAQGFTHVWLHGPELARLMATYGYDPDVTPQMLGRLIATGWTPVYTSPAGGSQTDPASPPLTLVDRVTLYALPRGR